MRELDPYTREYATETVDKSTHGAGRHYFAIEYDDETWGWYEDEAMAIAPLSSRKLNVADLMARHVLGRILSARGRMVAGVQPSLLESLKPIIRISRPAWEVLARSPELAAPMRGGGFDPVDGRLFGWPYVIDPALYATDIMICFEVPR